MNGLESWQKGSNSFFTPWFAFAALQENEFAAKAGEFAAKFSKDSQTSVNPLVARIFEGNPPATMKDVAERYGKLFVEIDKQWETALAATNSPAPAALPDAPAEAVRQILYAADAPANLCLTV